MNILFTCVGRRNYLLSYFREVISTDDLLYATDMQLSAPGMQEADRTFVVPPIYSSDYISTLLHIIREEHIDAVISLNDLELPILSKHRAQIEACGAKLLVSNERVIDITFDKLKTAEFLSSIGLNTPATYVSKDDFIQGVHHGAIDYPIVVKPRWGSASIGIEFPENEEEFLLVERLSRMKLERTILKTASSEHMDRAILFQEKIVGKEYGMDILNDFEGNYVGTFVREKLSMRVGETDKATSVKDERFERVGETISKHLRHIGNLDCDVLEKDGELYVLELNPRFGGGYPFSHEAGAKSVACYYEWLKGGTNIDQYLNYKAGLSFAKCDRLLQIKEK
ncbi:ATP-grasp domain-containing protein [Porphyromonas gingivicanis]|uniref:ATP-grasp domain-containing protein n=1 Tax=Porphyromonas gingivicanis TaxID=266762 RepID=UPI000470AD1A|nr:ATP-grasp domain-containing protein [Porphyromonas gingivicanis]